MMLVWFHMLWMGELTVVITLALFLSAFSYFPHFIPFLDGNVDVVGGVGVVGHWLLLVMVMYARSMTPPRIGQILFLMCYFPFFFLFVSVGFVAWPTPPIKIVFQTGLLCCMCLCMTLLFAHECTAERYALVCTSDLTPTTATAALVVVFLDAIVRYIEEGQWKGVRGYPIIGNLRQFRKNRMRKHQYEVCVCVYVCVCGI